MSSVGWDDMLGKIGLVFQGHKNPPTTHSSMCKSSASPGYGYGHVVEAGEDNVGHYGHPHVADL